MKKTFLLIFLSTLFLLTGCTKQVETIKTKIETTDEAKHYIVVTAYDKDSEEVWNYKSNEVYVGQADNIEYYGEKDNKLMGYTDTMKLVNVEGDSKYIGTIVDVEITDIKTWSMDGKIVE